MSRVIKQRLSSALLLVVLIWSVKCANFSS